MYTQKHQEKIFPAKPIYLLAAFLIFAGQLFAQPEWAKPHNQMSKGRNLEDNLYLLNLWGKQPGWLQEIYTAAFNDFAKGPEKSYAGLTESEEVMSLCEKNGLIHWGGPMLGDITHTGAKVWVRTVSPGKVEVKIKTGKGERTFGPVMSTKAGDLAAVVPVTGLDPGKSYRYSVLIDGKAIKSAGETILRTLPAPDAPVRMRIAFGTCFHRWGIGNHDQVNQILKREPMAMLLGGDIAAQDRRNNLAMHRADYLLRDVMPAWQKLSAAVPLYATWDDHDYFDNDLWGIPEGYTDADRRAVRKVYSQAWNNPSYGNGDEGVYLRTRIGPADVIMVDGRYFRTGEKGSFLGDEQMKWLEKQLLDCKGPFIILSCGTMWSDYVSEGKDSWGVNDPEGRERILSLIEKNHIGGVLLISGDRHGARGFRIPRPSGFYFYEFEPGSLGGRYGPEATKPEWTTQLFGFDRVFAFGEFDFDTTKKDPEVTFRLIQDNGNVLYQITLKRSDITP